MCRKYYPQNEVVKAPLREGDPSSYSVPLALS